MPLTPAELTFNDASPTDVETIVGLVQSAYRGEPSRAGWTTEADLLDGTRTNAEAVLDAIGAPRSVLLLAARTGASELLACCRLKDEGDGHGYFGMFAVRPDQQGAGIGRTVLAEAERRVTADWGCAVLRMTVIRQRTELIAWYERLGFELTGNVTPFPAGDERFGRPKRPDLEFVELTKTLRGTS